MRRLAMVNNKQLDPTHEYHSTEWLKDFYFKTTGKNIDLYKTQYKPVHDFMFIWNIFERDILNKGSNGRINHHEDDIFTFAKDIIQDQNHINAFFDFLQKTYTNPHDGELRFEHLELGSKKEIIKRMLNDTPSLEEKNQVCLMIAWRYRNNLFHGNKVLSDIIEQINLFENVNEYLISYIEAKNY